MKHLNQVVFGMKVDEIHVFFLVNHLLLELVTYGDDLISVGGIRVKGKENRAKKNNMKKKINKGSFFSSKGSLQEYTLFIALEN